MFGAVEGSVKRETAVKVDVYRDLSGSSDRDSGDSIQGFDRVQKSLAMRLGEVRDRESYAERGRDVDSLFRGIVESDEDVQIADGLQVVSTDHHTGRKFAVVASRQPGGHYRRLLLEEIRGAQWGT